MTEQIEKVEGTTEGATATEDSSYKSILTGELSASEDRESVAKPEPAKLQSSPTPEPQDPEFVLREGLKAKLSEIEEWKKGYMRQKDYTTKTQEIAEIRKSLEDAFGRKPDIREVQALGQLVKQYYTNPKAKQIVDKILQGQIDALEEKASQAGPQDPVYSKLEAELNRLKEQLGQVTSSVEEREMAKRAQEADRTWKAWIEKRKESNKDFQVSEEVDQMMAHLIGSLTQIHPDWGDTKILDEAYRHATIDDLEKQVRDKVLVKADESKTLNPPKITPKAPAKDESRMSYRDIFLDQSES